MPLNSNIKASWVGPGVCERWRAGLSGKVLGVTSRGHFLWLPSNDVFFLSKEPWRGPLTINLAGALPSLPTGAPFTLDAHQARFTQANTALSIEHTPVWQPPSAPAIASAEAIQQAIETTLAALRRAAPLPGWLAILAGDPASAETPAAPLADFRRAAASLETREFVWAAQALLGLGKGLTPSGDDVIAGALLWLRRAGRQERVEEVWRALHPAARQATTSLSVALMEQAALGRADERILAACDAWLAGQPLTADLQAQARGYGGSSGLDMLAGMACAQASAR